MGLPTLIATGIITVLNEADYRLTLTLPGVLSPILTWLGVGNFASVLLLVAFNKDELPFAQALDGLERGLWLRYGDAGDGYQVPLPFNLDPPTDF